MDKVLVNLVTLAHIIWWPISKLINAFRAILLPVARAVIFLLSPIWLVGNFLLLPFIHLAKALYHIVTFPLQVKWLERIETLYIYLGTAGLIGCVTGAVLYFTFKFLSSSLSIAATSQPRKSRTIAEFKSAQRKKQDRMLAAPPPPTQVVLDTPPGRRGRGLLSSTIVEEEDSDF